MKLIFWWHHNENSNEFSFFCLWHWCFVEDSTIMLVELSLIRLHALICSYIAVNLEYFLWGGKPHSLVLLK